MEGRASSSGRPSTHGGHDRAGAMGVGGSARGRFLHHKLVRVAGSGRATPRSHTLRWLTSGRYVSAMTLALVLSGLLWRVIRYALGFPIWGDEAFLAINLCERDLAGLARPLEYWQVAPWGFLAAEYGVTRLLGLSERALRLFPNDAEVLFQAGCLHETLASSRVQAVLRSATIPRGLVMSFGSERSELEAPGSPA